MARYLVAASPIPGHVIPLIEVAADLVARGHDVTVLTGEEYRVSVEGCGAVARALPAAARPHRSGGTVALDVGPSLVRRWLTGRADMSSVFVEPLVAQSDALDAALATGPVDAVLCDVAFTGVLPLLLGSQPRPRVLACGVTPLTLSSVDTPPFGMGWQPRPDFDYRRMTWTVHHVLFGDIRARLDAALGRAGAPRSPVFLTDWFTLADRVLQFSVPELEFPRRDLPPTVTFVGPVPPHRASPRRESAGRPTVVHVTQGTWDNEDLADLIVPTLSGLADRDDVTVVATTGRSGAPPLDPLPSNAHVTDYVPYGELLPKVDVMVSNGGWGGVHAALQQGIPLVIAGSTSDKPEVAARVAYSGAGIDLGTSRPRPAAIAQAVDRVLGDPSYRRAAADVARKMLQYNAFDTIANILDELTRAADAISER